MPRKNQVKHSTSKEFVAGAGTRGTSQARRWAGWSLIAGVGLAMSILSSMHAQSYQGSISRTAMVVSNMQADAQGMASEAILASLGNPNALDNLRSHRSELGVSMTLIESGGYASEADASPVLALQGQPGISLDGVRSGLAEFDNQVRFLEESAGQIRSASVAEEGLSDALDQIGRALENIEKTPQLVSGGWGNALSASRTALSRSEMRTMRVIFAPLRGAQALQTAWAQQFSQTASQLAEINARAQSDTSLSTSSRAQVKSLTEATQLLAQSSAVLAQTLPVRLEAQTLQSPIQEAASGLRQPLSSLGLQVKTMQAAKPLSWHFSWMGALMALVGLVGLARSAMTMGQDHWVASQESKAGHGLGDSIDRVARQLKRLTGRDGSVAPNARIEDDPQSHTFSLVANINRILEGNQEYGRRVENSVDGVVFLLSQSAGPATRASKLASRSQDLVERNSALARSIALELARMAQLPTVAQAQRIVEMITSAEVVMQEGGFKMDAMRENVQATSKRLKRLAEGAQNIAAASNVIDEISRRVKVLATNAAIEAAAHGEKGRRFAVLAKEIERLSQNAHETASDIARVILGIQIDAQETVAAMEQSTAEVVASTELTSRANSALRDIEKVAGEQARSIESVFRDMEKQALVGVKLSGGCDEASSVAQEIKGENDQVGLFLEQTKTACLNMKREHGADPSA